MQDRVHVVGDEDDRRPGALPARVEQVDDAALVGEVEGEQRLVGEDEHRVGDERLGHAQPLLLAAGEPADGRVRIRRRPDLGERGVDTRAILVAEAADAPAVAVETEPHEVAPAQDDVAVENALLRHIADAMAALLRRASLHHDAAGCWPEQPEQDAEQRRLAGAVGPEDGQQLAPLELEAEPFEQGAITEPERQVVDCDDAHLARAAASARTWSSCHCWKLTSGGRVSRTGTTGMPAFCAVARSRVVRGETAWAL